jgi:hypothetical protein
MPYAVSLGYLSVYSPKADREANTNAETNIQPSIEAQSQTLINNDKIGNERGNRWNGF